MEHETLIRIAASFVSAGVFISLVTAAGERLGSRIGGLLSNMPSNIVVSLIFISMARGEDFAARTALALPLGMAAATVFLAVFVILAPRGAAVAAFGSLAAWAAAAAGLFGLGEIVLLGGLAIYFGVVAACFIIVDRVLKVRAVERRAVVFRPSVLLVRAVFSGAVVAGAVTAAYFVPPWLTGLAASFPAVLLSTMVILTMGQGAGFARATAKVMMLSSSNIIVYALVAAASFPVIGYVWGSLISFAAALAWLSLLLPVVKRIT